METPRAGQRVQIEGGDTIFIVLRVDHDRHLADLLKLGSVRRVEAGVPLTALRLVPEAAAKRGDQLKAAGD